MITVREATLADVARLAQILRDSPEAGSWSAADLERSLAEPQRRCWVAEQDGGVLGLLLVQYAAADETEILTIAVDPATRRRGVASALLQAFLDNAKGRIFLEVRQSNTGVQRLYERFGFSRAGVRRLYYSSPPEDAVVMQLSGDQ